MTLFIHIPSPPLDAYIKCLWYHNGSASSPHMKMLPMPSLHLMINFGAPFQVFELEHTKPFADCAESWTVGLWSTAHLMHAPSDLQVLNVSFKPGGAYPFLRLPLYELHNQFISLDAIWGRCANEIRERLYAAPTIQARFALLERLLLARLCEPAYGLNLVQYAVGEIARRRGSILIRALCDRIGISQKHLITQFKQMVGGTLKELARLYRFRYVLNSIDPAQPVGWTLIARQAHYYDQSHFNKDFEAFTGHSPNEYLRLRRQAPDDPRYPSCLPTG